MLKGAGMDKTLPAGDPHGLTLHQALTMHYDDMNSEQKSKAIAMLQELYVRRNPNHPDPETAAAVESYKARHPDKNWDE